MIKKLKKFRRSKKVKAVREKATDAAEIVSSKAADLNPLGPPKEPEVTIDENVPRITDQTIAEHREEVLKGARKYIYPLQHSKHRIVVITVTVVVGAIVGLLVYCSLALYRYYQYNTFLYRVTQVIPFPIAKAGGHFVDYENYLFEVRHYVHYYETQQQVDFSGVDHQQLVQLRKNTLQQVINEAYIKQLAQANHVSVSDKEVNDRLNEVRNQNRLGGNNKVFSDVLRDYWGWSINDFKRSLKTEILSEKVAAKLDTADTARANNAQAQAAAGADFTALAKQVSDDPSAKSNGGNYGFSISETNPNVPPEVVNALFSMKVGQVSNVILASPVLSNQGPSLQIVKLTGISGNTVTAQHITINLKDISVYIKQLEKQKPYHAYVHF